MLTPLERAAQLRYEAEAIMEMMQGFKNRLTDSLRQRIIRHKLSVMTREMRTPMHSGYFVYKAFLDEGLSDFAQVTQYLMANGIGVG